MALAEHEIIWRFESDHIKGSVACNAAPDADCRLSCPNECEVYFEIKRKEDGTITHDDCKAEMTLGDCNVALWMNDNPFLIPELNASGQIFEIARTPIRPIWNAADEIPEWVSISQSGCDLDSIKESVRATEIDSTFTEWA